MQRNHDHHGTLLFCEPTLTHCIRSYFVVRMLWTLAISHMYTLFSDTAHTMPPEAAESGTNKGFSTNGGRVNSKYGASQASRAEE